ncbi:MAG: Hsp20 family protein [Bacilli bacterium]|nr:Hsp20 family protein [Bacilli bacterium]
MLPSRLFYDDMLDRFDDRKMSCDVYEKEGKFYLDMDIPGFKKEDIKIECHKGTLTIKAEHHEDVKAHDKRYICRERHFGKMERSFYLGDIDEDTIKASFKDGTLNIVVETKKNSERKQITIE